MKLGRNQIDGLTLAGIGMTAAGLLTTTNSWVGQVILAIDAVALVILGVNQGTKREK